MKELKIGCTAKRVHQSILFLLVLLTTTFVAHTQTKTISGKVVDALNQPVADVSVTLKGQTTGTTTNEQGFYTIAAAPGDILVFSSVVTLSISL